MKDEENISEYFERVDSIVNAIRGFEVEVPNSEIVENILRTFLCYIILKCPLLKTERI